MYHSYKDDSYKMGQVGPWMYWVAWFVVAALIMGGFLAWDAYGGEPQPLDDPPIYLPVRYWKVTDGDTIRGDVLMPFGLAMLDRKMRAENYDTWESRRTRHTVEITDEELRKGVKAKLELIKLLDGSQGSTHGLYFVPGKQEKDVYGRFLGKFYVKIGGQKEMLELGQWARANGHCRPLRLEAEVEP